MKRFFLFLLLGSLLIACQKDEDMSILRESKKDQEETGEGIIVGLVEENTGDGILIQTEDGSDFLIPAIIAEEYLTGYEDFKVDDVVVLEYDGRLTRDNPPKVIRPRSLKKIDDYVYSDLEMYEIFLTLGPESDFEELEKYFNNFGTSDSYIEYFCGSGYDTKRAMVHFDTDEEGKKTLTCKEQYFLMYSDQDLNEETYRRLGDMTSLEAIEEELGEKAILQKKDAYSTEYAFQDKDTDRLVVEVDGEGKVLRIEFYDYSRDSHQAGIWGK